MSYTAPVERPEPKHTNSAPNTSSDRVQYTAMSTSASPPMSPSAFSPSTPRAPSPDSRPSKSFPNPFSGRALARASTTDSIFRSRSKSPRKLPPAAINTKIEGSTSQVQARPVRTDSEPAMSPTSPTHPVSPTRPTVTIRKARKTSGTMHYGRHSNEWLFGGISVRETMKGIMGKDNDNQDN